MDDKILIAVQNFIKASVRLLKKNYHERPLPDLIEPFRIFTENSWEIQYRRSFGNYRFLYENYYNEICTMPETLVLIEEIQLEKAFYLGLFNKWKMT